MGPDFDRERRRLNNDRWTKSDLMNGIYASLEALYLSTGRLETCFVTKKEVQFWDQPTKKHRP